MLSTIQRSTFFPDAHSPARLLLLIAVLVLVVPGSFYFFDFAAARRFQSFAGYYFCTAALLLACFHCYRVRTLFRSEIREIGNQATVCALAIAAIGSYLMLLHEPQQMRVFNDEPSHALTAQAMAQERAVFAPQIGFFESGSLIHAEPEPFYRLYFYPYVVSLLHNLTGVRLANGFIANGIIGFFTLAVTFVLGWKLGKTRLAGYAAQLLLLGLPLLHQVTNSAGYDLLNLFLFICFTLTCFYYLRSGGLDLLNLAISTGLLLAYCRSESVIYMSALGVVFLLRLIHEKRLQLSLFAVISPVFLLVPLAARTIGKKLDENMSVFYDHVDTGFFGIQYFSINAQNVLRWLFSTESATLNSWLISALFLASVLVFFLTLRTVRSASKEPVFFRFQVHDWILLTFTGLAGIHLSIILCLFWDPTDASAIRFFLPINFVFVLWIIRSLHWMKEHWRIRLFAPLAALAFAFMWLVTLPKAARAEVTHGSLSAAAANRSLEWAQAHDDGRTLFAVKSNYHFLLHKIPAVTLSDLSNHTTDIFDLVAEGYYDRVVLLEFRYFNPDTHAWTQSFPRMPIRPEIVTARIDGWRGSLHGETEVRQVLRLQAKDGSITTIHTPSDRRNEWTSDREFFDYIRSLQMLDGDQK